MKIESVNLVARSLSPTFLTVYFVRRLDISKQRNMQQLRLTIVLIKICLLSTIAFNDVIAAAVQKDQYQSLMSGQGLYNASDNIVILNATNFKSSVYADTRGWLVEFYNSWCGFCFRFAPIWKGLANDIYNWRNIVVVAAIDCADDDNNPICREYEIMHYPLLKYFSVNAHPSSFGITVEKADNIDGVRHNLIDRLEKEQQEGRGITWPNITPYRNVEVKDIWKAVTPSVQYFFLIFENVGSHLGTEVILDFYGEKSLQIRRVTSENELLCVTNKINKFPSLIVFNRNDSQKQLHIRLATREGVRNTIKDYMKSKGITIEELTMSPKNEMRVTDDVQQSQIEHGQTSVGEDYLYQLDLENTLRYSINHEIPLSKHIEGSKMEALKMYINILASYFPMRHSGVFLDVIRQVVTKKDAISGEEFSQVVRSTEEEMAPVYSGQPQWIGCKGSTETYRGYPCGLWTMFHMLTVNFAMQNKDKSDHDPTDVVKAIHGYVKHFFGCADCSNHFVDMAARNKIFDVRSGDENILWLWKAHNEVNARLSGDDTEDPEHKKIQYPSAEHCPLCRYKNGTWNETQVLHYLKKKYSYAGINYTGSSDKHIENTNRDKVRQERLATSKSNLKRLGWDFTIFDISICVLLYVTSAAILILVCIKFAVKRSYRKKAYVSLLGKV